MLNPTTYFILIYSKNQSHYIYSNIYIIQQATPLKTRAGLFLIFILQVIILSLQNVKHKKKVTTKKRSHTLIFRWIAFSFDYGTHLLWHFIDKLLQCHKISVQCCIHFFTKIL